VRVTGRVLTGGIFHWAGKESTRNDLVEVAKTVPGVQKVIVDLDERAVPLD
jgi:hypothetical protein